MNTKQMTLGEAIARIDRDDFLNRFRVAGKNGVTRETINEWAARELWASGWRAEGPTSATVAANQLLRDLGDSLRHWDITHRGLRQRRWAIK